MQQYRYPRLITPSDSLSPRKAPHSADHCLMMDYQHWSATRDLQLLQGSKEVLGGGLILAAKELGVKLLVTVQGDTASGLVSICCEGIEGVVDLGNIHEGTTGDHI